MNRDMLMAGLEFFASPYPLSHNAAEVMYRHDERHDDGRVHSTLLEWHDVAAAARERIEALEQAEWFVKLPENEAWQFVRQQSEIADRCERNERRLNALNAAQAETIRRLQTELEQARQAPLIVRRGEGGRTE